MSKSKKVVIFSTVHKILDTRISYRQAQSLKKYGYNVKLFGLESIKPDINGIEFVNVVIPKFRIFRFIRSLTIVFELIKERADIYHFHDPELIPTGILLSFLGKKVVYDIHEHYPDVIIDRHWIPEILKYIFVIIYNIFEAIALKRFSGIIVAVETIADRYKDKDIDIEVIHNYPLNDILLSDRELKNKQFNNTLLYLGKIWDIRGIENLLQMLKIVHSKIPVVKLKLIGEIYPADYDKVLEEKITELKLNDSVYIEDAVPYRLIREKLLDADIGLLTINKTTNNLRALPNKLFEYMAGGLPVIASDFPVMGRIIKGINSGILVDPDDIEETADAVISLLKNKDLREEMSRNGLKAVKEKYNWEFESKKLIDFYNNLN